MKDIIKAIIMVTTLMMMTVMNNSPTEAKPVESDTPHVYIDQVAEKDWYLNDSPEVIFAGCGSPLFPNKKTHYILRNSIQYGTMKDGRLVIKCNFKGMYEFACFYPDKQANGSHRARFIMGDTINGTVSPLEVDSVLAEYNGQYIAPFPALGKNIIPARVVEMLYYIVKGEKYYGDLNPQDYLEDGAEDIINPYTPDLYARVTKN